MTVPDYDVAISFLTDPDLAVAEQLADALGTRYRVFVYTREQPRLVGTHGLDKFAAVFHDQSQLAVILHRQGWGEKGMTQAERSAMVHRREAEGEGFLLVVSMDGSKPLWVDPDNIYHGLDQYGLDGLVEAVEVGLDRAGARKPAETTVERLQRKALEHVEQERRDAYRETQASADFFKTECFRLPQVATSLVEHFKSRIPGTHAKVEDNRDRVSVTSHPFCVTFQYEPYASKFGRDSLLHVFEKKQTGDRYLDQWRQISERDYEIVLGSNDEPKWRSKKSGEELTLEDLLSKHIRGLIERASNERDRQTRGR